MFFRKCRLSAILIILLSCTAYADIDFPYLNSRANIPIYEEPFSGMGSYYGSLSNGIKTVLWNPAGIMRVGTAEGSFTFPMNLTSVSFGYTSKIDDLDMDATGNGLSTGVFFTDDPTDLTKKQRNMNTYGGYSNSGASLVFDQTFRVNDSVGIGVRSLNPIDIELGLAGNFPMFAQYSTNYRNTTTGGLSVDGSGFMTYTYDQGGLTYTYTSAQPVWNSFLEQRLRLPTTAVSQFQNDMHVDRTVVLTGGYKYDKFSFGLNVTPLSARADIENSMQLIVSRNAGDGVFYTPDFDPTNQADVAAWMLDPTRFGAAAGYKANTIDIPAGDVIMDSKWSGTYTGAAVRSDLGMMYDISDNTTLSLMLENITGSTMTMHGRGINYFANHRFNSTSSPNIDPDGTLDWDPFTAAGQDFVFAPGQGLYMDNNIEYNIPRRTKIGVAIKTPFLLAIDYETPSTPTRIRVRDSSGSYQDVNLSNMNVLRMGAEMGLFRSPVVLKGGMAFLYKPVADNAEVQSKIDSIFKLRSRSIPFIPIKFDMGLEADMYKGKTGFAFGIDGLSLINMYSFDLTYSGNGKTLFYTLYHNREDWQLSYTAMADILATMAEIKSSGKPIGEAGMSDVKWKQAVSMTLRF